MATTLTTQARQMAQLKGLAFALAFIVLDFLACPAHAVIWIN